MKDEQVSAHVAGVVAGYFPLGWSNSAQVNPKIGVILVLMVALH
jgi:hypothetical protein